MAASGVITFGDFRLDPASGSLHRDGTAIALTPKAFELLRHLLAHPGDLLTKDDLLDAVWPESPVGDTVLKVCVAELRKALEDDAAAPRYVATVHRRGYRFVAGVGSADETAPAPRRTPGIVGRAAALARIDDALAAAAAGIRQLVFVTGEAGIGKTTVVESFLTGLDVALPRGRGHCREEDDGRAPYAPLLAALGSLCRDPQHGAAVSAALRRAAPTWSAALPGTDGAVAPPAAAAPTRTRMLLELIEALETLGAATPLVLVLEDLHWSDYSTLDWLATFARRPEPARVLVVATYRPVDVVVRGHPLRRLKEDLASQGRGHEVPLEFLSEAEVADYLRHRLASDALPDDLARRVHTRTDGNPLFMTHVVDLLLARGRLTRRDVGWSLDGAPAEPDDIPDSLRQMLAQEVASLGPRAQEVLAAASVAGTEHAAAAVAAALDAPLAEIEDVCTELVRQGQMLVAAGAVIWPDGTRSARFGFLHALYQSTLYGDLTPARRGALHRRIGLRLEAAFGPAAGAIAADLARHFAAAGDVARAVHHHREAAERALGRRAYPEAIEHLDRALELLAGEPDDADRAQRELDIRMALGPALMAVRGFAAPEVEQCYARARALCAAVGVTRARARALRGLGVFALTRGDLVLARALAEESLALAARERTPGPLAKAHVTIGTTLYYLGELDAAARHLERARRGFARMGTGPTPGTVQAPLVNALAFLAMTTWFRGRPDAALRLAEEARAVADTLAHPLSVLWAAHVTAILRHARGEPGPAADAAGVAIRLATDLGLRQWTAWGVFFHGWLATTEGRLADGIAAMHEGLAEYRATGAELGRVYFTATLAEAHARAGDTGGARALVDESLALTTARSERYYAPELHRLRAGLLDDAAAARAELRRAVTLATAQGNRALALRAATDLAVRLGGAAGRRVLAPHYARFREGRDTADLQAARRVLTAGR